MKKYIFLLCLPFISFPANADELETRGVIKAVNQAVLSSEISSRIIKIPFSSGDQFKSGNALVIFDCSLFNAEKNKIEAQIKAAKAKLANNRKLHKLRSIGELEVLLSETEVERGSAELKMASINTSRCKINAPWDGYVIERLANEHESVELNQPLISIVSLKQLEIELIAPASWLKWLKPGTGFTILIDETGNSIQATIAAIGNVVDTASHTISIRANIKNPEGLLPGMSGTAYFDTP